MEANCKPAPPASAVEPDEISPLELFTTLGRTGLFLEALQRESLTEHGLAFTEYSVLRLLVTTSGQQLAPSVLAERIVCTTGAMTKLVDRLERGGLVERAPDPTDRRGVLVGLTAAGRRKARNSARSYRAGCQRVLDRLEARESDELHRNLQRLLDVMERDRAS